MFEVNRKSWTFIIYYALQHKNVLKEVLKMMFF